MTHIKGYRFGLPVVQRLGLIDDSEAHRIAWNTHAGLEIHYVLKGRFTWEVRRGRRPLTVCGGHFVVIPAGREHRAAGESGTPSFRLGVILEPFARTIARGSSFSPEDLRLTLDALSSKTLVLKPLTPNLVRCLRALREAMNVFNPEDPASRLRLRVLSELLLIETKTTLTTASPMPHDTHLMENIRRWMDEHLTTKITVSQLVAMSGYGRSQFFGLFRKAFGLTPNDYVIRERIILSKRLLLSEPNLPLAEVGRRVGFNSHSLFTLTFRRQTGLTPTAFRELSPNAKNRHDLT